MTISDELMTGGLPLDLDYMFPGKPADPEMREDYLDLALRGKGRLWVPGQRHRGGNGMGKSSLRLQLCLRGRTCPAGKYARSHPPVDWAGRTSKHTRHRADDLPLHRTVP